ncbi:hypothetical protein VNO80_03329 [Phaseolus coccineus]|uniref:Uncharacterized protein n=1 Tax=Phaseolus coccineus TaxID=3886 RepID=A0AAN9NRH2_PHACN
METNSPSPRSLTAEVWVRDDYRDACNGSPRQRDLRFLSMLEAYHIYTRARMKATVALSRNGVATMMEEKLGDEINRSKKSVGRISDAPNGGRRPPTSVVGRRSVLKDSFQLDVMSNLRDPRCMKGMESDRLESDRLGQIT